MGGLLEAEACRHVTVLTRNVVQKWVEKEDDASECGTCRLSIALRVFSSLLVFISLFRDTSSFPHLANAVLATLTACCTELTDNREAFLLSLLRTSDLAPALPSLAATLYSCIHYDTPNYLHAIAMNCLASEDDSVLQKALERDTDDAVFVMELLKEEKVRQNAAVDQKLPTLVNQALLASSLRVTRRKGRSLTEEEQQLVSELAQIHDACLQTALTDYITSSLQRSLSDADVTLVLRCDLQTATVVLLIPLLSALQPVVALLESDAFWVATIREERKLGHPTDFTRSYANLLRVVHQLELTLPNPLHLTALGHLSCCVLAAVENMSCSCTVVTRSMIINNKIDSYPFTPSLIRECCEVFDPIDSSSESSVVLLLSMLEYELTLQANRLLLQVAHVSEIEAFLAAPLPAPFLHRYLKKVCCSRKDAFSFRDDTPLTTTYFAAFDASLHALCEVAEKEGEGEELVERLTRAGIFLNKYVFFSQEERELLVRIKQALCRLTIALNDASIVRESVVALRTRQDELLFHVLCFVTDLMSCFALNEECTSLFEGELWTLATSLSRIMKLHPDWGIPRFS